MSQPTAASAHSSDNRSAQRRALANQESDRIEDLKSSVHAELLKELAGPEATFREHQLEAIQDLVVDSARVLCVQRTGWGKSAVYFLATALGREKGAGPTLIVSPLLALMRNQIAAAERLGIRAHTINSTNREEWDEVRALLAADAVDLLLISPERLNNPRFRDDMLPLFVQRVGLVVVDEAHRLGCRFDGWRDHFDFSRWKEAFAACGIDAVYVACAVTDVAAALGVLAPLFLPGAPRTPGPEPLVVPTTAPSVLAA